MHLACVRFHPSNRVVLTPLLAITVLIFTACGTRETAQVLSTASTTTPSTWATSTLGPFEAALEADRATAMASFENNMATAYAQPTPEIWPTLPPHPTYDPNQNQQGFVPCEPVEWDKVHIENCWARDINQIRVSVRAGVLKSDAEQGALQVQDDAYPTPNRSGRARIVQENDLLLTVRTAAGDFFGFDVGLRQWVAPQVTTTPRPLDDYRRGIFPCNEPSPYVLVGNCWADLIGERYYEVQAGAAQAHPLAGFIILRQHRLAPGSSVWQEKYFTPRQAGRVEVVTATGFILILRATDGTLFAFDLKTHKWVPVPATPTATATLPPDTTATVTPIATATSRHGEHGWHALAAESPKRANHVKFFTRIAR